MIGTAMMLRRASYLSTAEVIAGNWPRNRLSAGRESAGAVMGLIGFGSISPAHGSPRALARHVGDRL